VSISYRRGTAHAEPAGQFSGTHVLMERVVMPNSLAADAIPAPRRPIARPSARSGRTAGVAEWAVDAACRQSDPDALFVQGAAQNQAKIICRACPVRVACLADALDNRVEFGVWGGMTERERRALLRRRPNVTSWGRLLEAAARDQGANRPAVVAAG
jgi:WhiB family redox-sensing transcriptional regulator